MTLFAASIYSFAQNPAHFKIGEEELNSTHVYSLKYHPDDLLYAATNYGLYMYKNGSFQKIPWLGKHSGEALFSLNLNSKNELFCSNLSGQIFHLTEKGLELFLETPVEYRNANFDFSFDNLDAIIIQSKVFARYDDQWEVLLQSTKGTPAKMNSFDRSNILCSTVGKSEIYELNNSQAVLLEESKGISSNGIRLPLMVENELITLSNEAEWVNITNGTYEKLHDDIWYLSQTDRHEVWLRSTISGVHRLTIRNGSPIVSERMFDEVFISSVAKADDGSYFLGTFNKGVIVVPSIQSMVYKTGNGELQGLAIVPPNFKFPTSFIESNRCFKVLRKNEGQCMLASYDRVFYKENIPFNLSNAYPGLLFQYNSIKEEVGSFGTIKDVVAVDERAALVATSFGVFKVGEGLDHISWRKNGSGENWWRLRKEHFRRGTVGYDKLNNGVYFNSTEGLFYVNESGDEEEVLLSGESIRCVNIFSDADRIICATNGNGILFISKGKVVRSLLVKDGLGSNDVRRVIKHLDKLYIAHKEGFQIYDPVSDVWTSIGSEFGILRGSVRNFQISNDYLWFITGGKLLSLPLKDLNKERKYKLLIEKVGLGAKNYATVKSLESSYDESDLSVYFDFKGIQYEKEAMIEYRLNNGGWKSIPATSEQLSFAALAPGSYELMVRVNYHGVLSHEETISFRITPPFWQTWWFYSIVILTILGVSFFIFRRRLKKVRIDQERKIEEQRLRSEMLESELKALRSQMNPHFIFNSLNSIQDLILREETENSYDYIVLFSKLVRSTLSYSNLDFIPIEKELEFLNVYLSLEKLRFEKDFEYTITYEGDQEIQIPSLLIQPFVENAIVHGLMHKRGEKKLEVHFELNDMIICTIIDNGVGRVKAKEIQDRQRGDHKSFAMEAIRQRLELLNKQLGGRQGYYGIEDVFLDDVLSGTKVTVHIPYRDGF